MGPHQAEKGPFGYIHHDALAVSLWWGRRVGGMNLNPKAGQGTGGGRVWIGKVASAAVAVVSGCEKYKQGALKTFVNLFKHFFSQLT